MPQPEPSIVCRNTIVLAGGSTARCGLSPKHDGKHVCTSLRGREGNRVTVTWSNRNRRGRRP